MMKFKVGDKVYYPARSNQILKITSSRYKDNGYPLEVIYDALLGDTFNTQGKSNLFSRLPKIFHATQENYELLSKLYPDVEFEPPSKLKEPLEVIQAMFDGGWKYVVISQDGYDRSISDINHCAHTVIPIDPKTGKAIIDFIDGEIILESDDD